MNQEANLSFLLAILPFRCPFALSPYCSSYNHTFHKLKNWASRKSFLRHSFNLLCEENPRRVAAGLVLYRVWGGNSPCPPGFSGNFKRMLISAGACKAPGPEFRYECSTSSGANKGRERAMARDSVVVAAVPPGSEAAASPPALTPLFHH